MGLKDQQIAALYLAVLCQHSINKLNAIDRKYSAFIDTLSPEARSLREQLEADLHPHLNNFENQKRFARLCEIFEFEKYLEKEFADFLAGVLAQEIEEFLAEQEKITKEKHQRETALAMVSEMDRKESLQRINALIERIEKVIKELKEEAQKLRAEIEVLQAIRDGLIKIIEKNTEKLDDLMVQIYRGCAQSEAVHIIDISGYKLNYSDKELAERMEIHFHGKIKSGVIPPENIENEERKVIKNLIYENTPKENLIAAGKEKIEKEIDAALARFQALEMKQNGFAESKEVTHTIIVAERKKEIVDIAIDVKRKILDITEQRIEHLEEHKDTLAHGNRNELSKDVVGQITGDVLSAENALRKLQLAQTAKSTQKQALGQEPEREHQALAQDLEPGQGQVLAQKPEPVQEQVFAQELEPGYVQALVQEPEPGEASALAQEPEPGEAESLVPEQPQQQVKEERNNEVISTDDVSETKFEASDDDLDFEDEPAPTQKKSSHNSVLDFFYAAKQNPVTENQAHSHLAGKVEKPDSAEKDNEIRSESEEENNNDSAFRRRPS